MTQQELLLELGKREIERRQKISTSKTGSHHSEETRKKMCLGQQRRRARSRKSVGVDAVQPEY